MVFLLDNYDSFTYNLAQYLGELFFTLLSPQALAWGRESNDFPAR